MKTKKIKNKDLPLILRLDEWWNKFKKKIGQTDSDKTTEFYKPGEVPKNTINQKTYFLKGKELHFEELPSFFKLFNKNIIEQEFIDVYGKCLDTYKRDKFLNHIDIIDDEKWTYANFKYPLYIYEYYQHLEIEEIVKKIQYPMEILKEVLDEKRDITLFNILNIGIDIDKAMDYQVFYELSLTCANFQKTSYFHKDNK